ncbi:hypothetical protein, partial [Pseudomonas viridiflava]|uniref:hypothetical protein n=1 Tax=Pseudomonas viridiflava TaxID=33069 RepID=UPI00197E41FD
LYLLVMEAILAWASGGGSVRGKRLNRLTVHVQQILDRLELMYRERCYYLPSHCLMPYIFSKKLPFRC